jgi:hypothetical protein
MNHLMFQSINLDINVLLIQVSKDVIELRVDENIRFLYARSGNAVLIIEVVRNHKLEKPIKRVSIVFVMSNYADVI